jgi:protein tyrosine phosphatase
LRVQNKDTVDTRRSIRKDTIDKRKRDTYANTEPIIIFCMMGCARTGSKRLKL